MRSLSFFSRLFRSAFRNQKLTWINIIGLSMGLAVTMFLLVYLEFEFSYDKHFKDADRIYHMLTAWEEENNSEILPLTFEKLPDRLMEEIPEVEMASLLYANGDASVSREGGEKMSVKTYLVDSAFLRIFQFASIYGQAENALVRPGTCVLTRRAAERIFGRDVNPVGKTLIGGDGKSVYEVMAVIENVPYNTHFYFDVLQCLPRYGWESLEYHTYLKFRPDVNIPEAIKKCNALYKNMLETRFTSLVNARFQSITEPLTDIHISTQADFGLSATASKSNLFFIILVVLFVLGVAISNFIALYIVQGEKRALEISMRKANGASRKEVVRMLFGETFFVTALSFLLAIAIYYTFADTFAYLLGFDLPKDIGISGRMWAEFGILFLVIALVVGSYPAYYLSVFSPVELIRKSVVRKYRLTATSVVLQFSVVVFCISSLFIIWRQLNYISNLPLGYHAEDILLVNISTTLAEYDGLNSDLLQYPVIAGVAVAQGDPTAGGSGEAIRRSDQQGQESVSVSTRRVGPRYFELFQIPLIEGRYFSPDMKGEKQNVILSESTVAALGLKDPVGKEVNLWKEENHVVIGVVKDVIQSAHNKPGNWMYTADNPYYFTIAVQFAPGKYAEAKKVVKEVLGKRYKGTPLYAFLATDKIDWIYSKDKVTLRILMSGAVLAIFLALLGLLALTDFVARQKRKEISLRRVMGAQVSEIIYSLSRNIILRILPAAPIGIALSYYAMNRWLNNFEYAVNIEWWIFVLALIVTLAIVILTTFWQSLRAARANPAEALKTE